jgi:eukaryotic-like serine/threonine-protein kinase
MALSPPEQSSALNRQLEKYELIEEVGQGGMAVVYRGLDTSLKREVAVKILHQHLANQQESKIRFQREAHAVAKLRHDNILEIYDYSGLESADSYIVTEFIHGRTLREYLAETPISHPEIAAMITLEICNALSHAHSLRVIHRDIKPENIMIRDDGRVKLTDFGIAQIVDVQRLTVTGQILGSPAYMAPELINGKPVDYRTDLFSVGTLLYQMATGNLPFRGKNPHEVLKRIAEGKYIDPELVNPLVGKKLGSVIRRALANEPDDRYPSVDELSADLAEFLADADIEDPRAELKAYFSEPTEYSQALQIRIVATLTRRGKEALDAKQTPLALRHFNRVLCTDPQNPEVLKLLGRISQRRRFEVIGLAIVALFILGLGIYYGRGLFRSAPAQTTDLANGVVPTMDLGALAQDPDLTNSASASLDTAPVLVDSAANSPADQRVKQIRPRPKTKTGTKITRVTPPPLPLYKPRKVEIIAFSKAISIRLNGKKLGPYGPDLRFLTLPRGRVTLSFHNDPCCFKKEVTIGKDQHPKQLRIKLPWKPGRLSVSTKPKLSGADVVVGNTVARLGQTIEVPIPSYSNDGRATVTVKVSAANYSTVTKKVTVRANSTLGIVVPLTRLP